MYIYALTLNNRVVYIGKTSDLYSRYREHIYLISKAKSNKFSPRNKYTYISYCISLGMDLGISILEECNTDGCEEERMQIRKFSALMPLLNTANGRDKLYKENHFCRRMTAPVKKKLKHKLKNLKQTL